MTHHAVMQDKYGRVMRKLRISLLDACNMRCVYCMPEHPHFLPEKDWATVNDIARIAGNLCAMGIEEVRLTGGEPTLRKELLEIVHRLSELPLRKLGLTSNGLLLEKFLPDLALTNCRHLNISLDSLDRQNFQRITKRDAFPIVMSTILRARDMGFMVKVNAVVLKDVNDHEVLDFIDWSGREKIALRFLEVMNIGVMRPEFQDRFIPAATLLALIRRHYQLTPRKDAPDATAYTFIADNGADVGFIASESQPFCGGCSRLRLTATGHIRPCLFKESGIDLKPLARDAYPEALREIISLKPIGRLEHVGQAMHEIGG